MSIVSIFASLQVQSAKLKARLSDIDRQLELRYGDRYGQIKGQVERQIADKKSWYAKTRAEVERTGEIPLDRQQAATSDRFARAGSTAARKEGAIKQQLKELWRSLKNR
ncbi:hypothetical protein [Chamaesiphon sp. VAR_69_metabat_338]|uniref:hypothetical protein n=1 Tax=Chamaesiphon sp. VAR_69_metabat_338 TaxID=2964704 RepID=UPI00286EAA01|nr:hypothetical protein [Chamaesiphon sp. VAR_69_metabat_338]